MVDIVESPTDSPDPKQYIKRVRQRDLELNSRGVQFVPPFELLAKDGRKRKIAQMGTPIFRSEKKHKQRGASIYAFNLHPMRRMHVILYA